MYNKDNVFAKIIEGKLPCVKIYEDDFIIAINDAQPVAPIHILVIPKKSYTDLNNFLSNASESEISYYFKMIRKIAEENQASEYRIVINNGASAGQSVFHFHTHILSGFKNNDLIDKGL